jgi:hypothetical protein
VRDARASRAPSITPHFEAKYQGLFKRYRRTLCPERLKNGSEIYNQPTEIIGDEEIAELGRHVGIHREALRKSFLTLPRELQAPHLEAEAAESKLVPAK